MIRLSGIWWPGSMIKSKDDELEEIMMTPLRQEAIQVLETVPEEKLDYVIQIMKDTSGFENNYVKIVE